MLTQQIPRATPFATRRPRWTCAWRRLYVSCLTQDFCRAVLCPTPDAEARITRSTPFSALPSAFVCKYFMSAEADEFRRDVLAKHFRSVRSEKMDASRAQSREQYWVCLNYHG